MGSNSFGGTGRAPLSGLRVSRLVGKNNVERSGTVKKAAAEVDMVGKAQEAMTRGSNEADDKPSALTSV